MIVGRDTGFQKSAGWKMPARQAGETLKAGDGTAIPGKRHLVNLAPVRIGPERSDTSREITFPVGSSAFRTRLCDQPIGDVLRRHGIAPSPKRSQCSTWKYLIAAHVAVLAAILRFFFGRLSEFAFPLFQVEHHH